MNADDRDDFETARQRRAKLDRALADRSPVQNSAERTPPLAAGVGIAFKLSATFVVSVGVGGALGYGLGALVGGQAWFLLGGLVIGIAAGFRDVFRTAAQLQRRADQDLNNEADSGEGT